MFDFNSIENLYTELFNTSITFVNTNWELLNTPNEIYKIEFVNYLKIKNLNYYLKFNKIRLNSNKRYCKIY